jgi:O-antigen/teichoic acid export membrane protein
MAVVMAALAPLAIFVFFGSAFGQSAIAVWLLLPGIVAFSIWKIMSCYLLGRHLLKQDLVAATVAMIATVALDLLLIPTYGFRGAAVASSVAYTTAMLVDLYWVTQRSRLSALSWLVATAADSRPIIGRLRTLHLCSKRTGSRVG